MFFAKNQDSANEFRKSIQDDKVKKVYFARVKGNFKESVGEKVISQKWVYCKDFKNTIYGCIEQTDIGKLEGESKKTAKEAETEFRFKFYDKKSDTSVIKYIF